ncbi:MAG: condensation domain-containing protein, partial [Acidobacteriota bacterium]
ALSLRGPLDVEAVRQTFAALVSRHPALRTVFPEAGGQPVQQFLAAGRPLEVPLLRASGATRAERRAHAEELAVGDGQRPFDLERGPLLRVALYEIDADEHLLAFHMHHIVTDGWSIGVMSREIPVLYEAFARGAGPPTLPALPVDYGDVAAWQREWIDSGALEPSVEFFRRRMAAAPATVLPTDRPRPTVQSHRGGMVPIELPAELRGRLEALAREEGATLFMAMLAVFYALLGRMTGERQLRIGTPMAGRELSEVEGMLGFFANSLVLFGDLRGEPSFRQLLGRVRRQTLESYEHREVPFEYLVERLNVSRDAGRNPLFQVMFALQKSSVGEIEFPGLKAQVVDLPNPTTHFDMEWHLWSRGDALGGYISYSADLFEPQTVLALAARYGTLLIAALDQPDRPIGELEALPRWEIEEIRTRAAEIAPDREIRPLRGFLAALAPDAPAVVDGDGACWTAGRIAGWVAAAREAWSPRLTEGDEVLWPAEESAAGLVGALAAWSLGARLIA